MGDTTVMDNFLYNSFKDILTNGTKSVGARPRYASDGAEANSLYITDVFQKFDLSKGEWPISSMRPIGIRMAIEEMLWIYQDQTSDLNKLRERGVTWWDSWALDDGTIGQRYGATVFKHKIIDRLLEGLKKNPFNRRNIINLWQYEDLDKPAKLPPCAFQMLFDVRVVNETFYLDASLTQRSSDAPVAGMGINQMQYVALQMMVAKHFGWEVGTFSWHVMNMHIYDRHIDNVKIMLNRLEENQWGVEGVNFVLDCPPKTNFYDIKPDMFKLTNYAPLGGQLSFDMAI